MDSDRIPAWRRRPREAPSETYSDPHRPTRGARRENQNPRTVPTARRQEPLARTLPPALGSELAAKKLDQYGTEASSSEQEITDCEFVASYNLMEGLQKTIFVPGCPAVWTPFPESRQLLSDSGEYYRDENAARFPEHPMEPAVTSVFEMNPNFDTNVEIFACGSTLGDLLRFCMGNPRAFTFVVHVVGKTAFFVRRNLEPTEKIEGVMGYGHSFLDATTTWDYSVKGSLSHQRIVQYSFGGMRMLVRFEVDGFVLPQTDIDEGSSKAENLETQVDGNVDVDWDDYLPDFNPKIAPTQEAVRTELVVERKGRRVPQSAIFDVKTRASYKERAPVLEEQLPRLWLRQMTNLVLSFHSQGKFEPPEVDDVEVELGAWEMKFQATLGRLAVLLAEVREMAIKQPSKKLEVRGDEAGALHFHEVPMEGANQSEAISSGLRKQWEGKQ